MTRARLLLAVTVCLLLGACATPTASQTAQVINVYLTSAAEPWLNNVYDCAPSGTVINLTDPQSAELVLRVGEPADLTTPAFQISTEEILVVTNSQVGVGSLTADQVHALFLGQITNWKELGGNDVPVQVWAYAPDADLQQIFESQVMGGQAVTSQARLAVSVQAMSEAVETVPGSVGILTRRWKSGNTPEALSVGTAPVLVILQSEPQGAASELVSCLQSGK